LSRRKIASNERLWDRAINGIYLGSHSWAKSIRKWIESKPRSTDHPKQQRSIGRPKMHARRVGSSEARRRDGGDDPSRARSNAPSTGGMDRLE
jgi:hypothetical protein